jgi:putative sigma-54 modulation protein
MKHVLDYGTSSARSPQICCAAVLQLPAGRRIVKLKARFPSATRHTFSWWFFSQILPNGKGVFMNLTISGHHLEVTPALRGYVTSKLDRITRHFDQVVDVKVLLTIDNMKEKELRQRAECNVHVKGRYLFAESSHADLYAAVDELTDKLDRQVGRYKDKTHNHHHLAAKYQA